ncbi:MAG TPA: efflux RND transporter periplasmic adaptor subunit [Verrucomicrobia bacterium]|nr:efflux RND transporter periplasmic adaptor subunit [Verrucomicrobiota bacterium]HOP98190.1 efflux RND transporter periplasmic adaptor subunit [Verrucomicrobiota bacterium]HPU54876.1 efflux RND transporter periplasmic adaptor subunit [Verrucomicrobiota bacterium]
MKNLLIILVVLGLAAGGYYYWQAQAEESAPEQPERPTTAVVELRDITLAVAAAGDIGPDEMVSVRSEVNGRIAVLPVDIGDEVRKGDLLCALDDRDLQTERSSRLTDIEGARLRLQQAERVYERNKRLYADALVSQEVFQEAETAYELARNALERAEKALALVEDQLSKTRIVAPFDCTVLTRPVSIGQAVSGSGGFNSGTEIMTIADLREMIITAHMNQVDVIRLKPGQEVDVQVEAVPGLRLKGVVERIAPQATLRNNLKGFTTEIRLKDLDPRVRPGMTANLTIPIHSAENVLAIPLSAVFTEEGERFAYVKTGPDSYEMRPIEIGLSDYHHAEVVSGLREGEVVSLVRPRGNVTRVDRVPEPGGNHRTQAAPGISSTPLNVPPLAASLPRILLVR